MEIRQTEHDAVTVVLRVHPAGPAPVVARRSVAGRLLGAVGFGLALGFTALWFLSVLAWAGGSSPFRLLGALDDRVAAGLLLCGLVAFGVTVWMADAWGSPPRSLQRDAAGISSGGPTAGGPVWATITVDAALERRILTVHRGEVRLDGRSCAVRLDGPLLVVDDERTMLLAADLRELRQLAELLQLAEQWRRERLGDAEGIPAALQELMRGGSERGG